MTGSKLTYSSQTTVQNCVLGQKCPHTGCQEAKLLHLHLKTCPAGASGDAECPMLYHGCDQSRKLLAHYRRCRSLRARQAGSSSGGGGSNAKRRETPVASSPTSSHHHCLVCSLVARQARTMLERKSSPSTTTSTKGSCAKKTSSPRKVSYTVSTEAFATAERRPSTMKMPPPPPKQGEEWGAAASLASLAHLYETAKQMDGDEEEEIVPSTKGRNRAVSDAEVLHLKTEGTDEQPALRRERSASCGNVPTGMRKRNSSTQLSCETIEEEPEPPSSKIKASALAEDMDTDNLPIDLAR